MINDTISIFDLETYKNAFSIFYTSTNINRILTVSHVMRATLMCSVFILYLFLYFYSVKLWIDHHTEDDFIIDWNVCEIIHMFEL